jgi:ABC-type oligopeptide transport system substrate-binding subunit
LNDRLFDIVETGWGAAAFPDPETMFHSRLADERDNDNITGFKDPRIDAICEKSARTVDQKERIVLIKELDGYWRTSITSSCTGMARRAASPIGTNSVSLLEK